MLDKAAIEELSASFHVERVMNPRDNSYIRASGIGSCRRQIAYRLNWHKEGKEELPIWTHGLFTFDLGHGIHYRLQSRLSNVGPMKWVDAEPYIDEHGQLAWHGNCEIDLKNDEYRIAGHCDGLTRPMVRYTDMVGGQPVEFFEPTHEDDPNGKRYILDIKSITARERLKIDYDAMTGTLRNAEVKPSSFEKLMAPKDEHIAQVSLYSWMTTQPGFSTDRLHEPLNELPGIMIIYVAKDLDPAYYAKRPDEFEHPKALLNSPYKIFTVDASPRLIKAQLRKAEGIWAAVEEGSLPPRDFNHKPERPAYACVDCPFRLECYQEEGFFANDPITIPPRLQHRMAQVDRDLIVLG
jgi:hypothetical protein